MLYGADLAKREIAQRRQAVIVEGYTDVMACHLAGIDTAVATSGTSFGEGHIGILRRLLMDARPVPRRGHLHLRRRRRRPEGGAARVQPGGAVRHPDLRRRAARRARPVRPADLRSGDAAVRDLIAQRVPLFEFAIRSELARARPRHREGRLAALDAAAPIVGQIKDRGLRAAGTRQPGPLARHDGRALRARPGPAALRPGAEQRPGPAAGARPAWRPGRRRRAAIGRAANGQARGRAGRQRAPAPAPVTGRPTTAAIRSYADRARGAQAGRAAPGPVRPGVRRAAAPPASRRRRARGRLRDHRPRAAGRCRRPPAAGSGPSSSATPRPTTACARSSPSSPWSRCRRPAPTASPTPGTRARCWPGSRSWPSAGRSPQIKSRLQRLNPVTEQAEYNRMFGDLVALEQRRKVLSEPGR